MWNLKESEKCISKRIIVCYVVFASFSSSTHSGIIIFIISFFQAFRCISYAVQEGNKNSTFFSKSDSISWSHYQWWIYLSANAAISVFRDHLEINALAISLPDKQHLINFANVNKHAVRLRGSLTTTQWLKIRKKVSLFFQKSPTFTSYQTIKVGDFWQKKYTLFDIFICPKIQLWFPEKIVDYFWVKNSWKCCDFVKIEFLDKNLTFRIVWKKWDFSKNFKHRV